MLLIVLKKAFCKFGIIAAIALVNYTNCINTVWTANELFTVVGILIEIKVKEWMS